MRLRNKPWAGEFIANHPEFVTPRPNEWKGKWKRLFDNEQPIHIEVGTGKGKFIVEMAKRHPHINYIGIERQQSVIVSALKKIKEEGLSNVKLINVNASELTDIFDKGEVERIYLNFSDPWPKKRHGKRRLTHPVFLTVFERILANGGELHFKTDNQGLFEFSLVSFSEFGLLLKSVSLDLHNSGFEGNIMTEYEEKFSKKGHKIYRAEVQFR
jgi:tRNA (guanine-N7-)-methyltransferase